MSEYLENRGRSRATPSNTPVMYQCHMIKPAKLDDLVSHDNRICKKEML